MNAIQESVISIMGSASLPSPALPAFKDLEQRVETAMVEAMTLLKQPRIHYPDELIEHLASKGQSLRTAGLIEGCPIAALPAELFEINPSKDKIVLKKGAIPSKALQAILDPASAPISLDCLVAIQVCSFHVLMQILGEKQFDFLCSIHPHYNVQFTNADPRGAPRYLRLQTQPLLIPSDIKRGDIVRFDGVHGYLQKHPIGYWQGVNTICTHSGDDPLFDAHGFERPINEENICKLLVDAMGEPSIRHRAKGRTLRSLRWDIPKLFSLKQILEEHAL